MITKFYIGLFLALLLTPVASFLFQAQVTEDLGGVTNEKREIHFTLESAVKGDLQRKVEKQLKRSLPIWPSLVRIDNQINYSVFDQTSNNYGTTVVKGLDGHLIEKAYLRSANKIKPASANRLESRIKEIRRFQEVVKSKGKAFLLVISPNKPSLYPELIPNAFRIPGEAARKSSYDLALPMLLHEGIEVLDGHAFLESRKASYPLPFFASSGTHWNSFAACLVTNEIMRRVSEQTGKITRRVACDPFSERTVPAPRDRDLVQLANLWWPESSYSPTLEPLNETIIPTGSEQPTMLFVGTSFLWSLMDYFDQHRLSNNLVMWYYFKRAVRFPGGSTKPLDPAAINWPEQVFSRDAIILEVNEAFIHKAGYGFLDSYRNAP